LNNYTNCSEVDKINTQLERAKVQKSKLINTIYKEYELYLKLIRDLLYISVEKGLNELCSDRSIKNAFLNENEFFGFFEKKISKHIFSELPLITVEQLKINKIEKNIQKEINFNTFGESSQTKYDQKEKFQFDDGFQFEKPYEFKISEDVYIASEYYQPENNEKLVSLDLDNYNNIYSLSPNNFIENTGEEKIFISSLLELIDEVKFENLKHFENHNNLNEIDIYPENQSFKNFEVIDNSLEILLLNLSYKINLELFKVNLIKKMISQDSFKYLVGKKMLVRHPRPYIINFEFNINQPLLKADNPSSFIFFNISTVELEFKNLNLSIQRNKINELKNQFKRLIKKEGYWRQKEITLNKMC